MEQRMTSKEIRDKLLITLKSKIKGGTDNGDMCFVFLGAIGEERKYRLELLQWLRDNPDCDAADVLEKWDEICPVRPADFDYDTVLEDDEDDIH